jgi:hypothetical protein
MKNLGMDEDRGGGLVVIDMAGRIFFAVSGVSLASVR